MTTDRAQQVLVTSAHALAHVDDLESTLSTMLVAVARAFGVGSAAIVAKRSHHEDPIDPESHPVLEAVADLAAVAIERHAP